MLNFYSCFSVESLPCFFRICVFKLFDWLDRWSQNGQAYGFTPVCVLRCLFMLMLDTILEQTEQLDLPILTWRLTWKNYNSMEKNFKLSLLYSQYNCLIRSKCLVVIKPPNVFSCVVNLMYVFANRLKLKQARIGFAINKNVVEASLVVMLFTLYCFDILSERAFFQNLVNVW